jgi:hypothetical protein
VSFHARLVQDCPPILPQTAAYPNSKRPSAGLVKANGFFWLSEEAFLRDFAGHIEPTRALSHPREIADLILTAAGHKG